MTTLNETHDPALRSWLASANSPGCDFPIQNLPFAVFRRKGSHEAFRGGVAIGDQVVDLAAAARAGVFSGPAAKAAAEAGHSVINNAASHDNLISGNNMFVKVGVDPMRGFTDMNKVFGRGRIALHKLYPADNFLTIDINVLLVSMLPVRTKTDN